MAASCRPAWEQEHCQDCEAATGAQIPSGLTSGLHAVGLMPRCLVESILVDMLSS